MMLMMDYYCYPRSCLLFRYIIGLLTRNTIKYHLDSVKGRLGSVILAEESLAVGLLLLLAQQRVQAVELGLLVTVNVVPKQCCVINQILINILLLHYTYHQSHTKYCWLKMVPLGHRKALASPPGLHM